MQLPTTLHYDDTTGTMSAQDMALLEEAGRQALTAMCQRGETPYSTRFGGEYIHQPDGSMAWQWDTYNEATAGHEKCGCLVTALALAGAGPILAADSPIVKDWRLKTNHRVNMSPMVPLMEVLHIPHEALSLLAEGFDSREGEIKMANALRRLGRRLADEFDERRKVR